MKRKHQSSGRGLAVVALSMASLTLAPVSSQAATTVGPATLGTPTADVCATGRIFTQGQIADDSVTYDVGVAGGSASVITGWATRAGAAGGQGAIKVMSRDSFDAGPPVASAYTVLHTSDPVTITPNQVNTVTGLRIPVPGGGEVGYQPLGGSQLCLFNAATADNADNVAINGLNDGTVGTSYTTDTAVTSRRLNLQVTYEPDVDIDGFGDESQDRCPGAAGPDNGCPLPVAAAPVLPPPPPPDVIKPTLGTLRFARSSFKAAGSGAAFAAQKKKSKKKKKGSNAPTGTKVSFTLSEAGSVTFTAERKSAGRRDKSKCKTQTRKNRKKAKCTLYKKVAGSFTVPGRAGANTFTFRGRIGAKALSAGEYRLNGIAIDAARNVSAAPTQKTFKIVK